MFVRVCSNFFIFLILCFDRSLRQLIFYGLNTGSVEISTLAESIKLQKYGEITFFMRLPKQLLDGNEHTRTLDQNSQEARGILVAQDMGN